MYLVEVTSPHGTAQRLWRGNTLVIGSDANCAVRVDGAAGRHVTVNLRDVHSAIVLAAPATLNAVHRAKGEYVLAMPLDVRVLDHAIAIRDVRPQRFEASYGAIAPEEVALVDAITTGDAASRIVYADWLDDRGDLARAELVRALAGAGVPDDAQLVLLASTNVRWRARVLQPAIERCKRADCPGHWGALERTPRADLRSCTRCMKLVLYCVNVGQADEHTRAGGVVVFDPLAVRDAK